MSWDQSYLLCLLFTLADDVMEVLLKFYGQLSLTVDKASLKAQAIGLTSQAYIRIVFPQARSAPPNLCNLLSTWSKELPCLCHDDQG